MKGKGMPKKTDSKDGLGDSIASAFDDAGEENTDDKEDTAGGGDRTGSRDTDDKDSQDDKTGKDSKDDKTGKKEEDDDDGEKTVTLTESRLKEIVGGAVKDAVAKTNSTKDRALEKQRKTSQEDQERLVREREDAQLNGLKEEDKTRMREVHKNDRRERELDQRDRESADMFRAGKTEQHLGSYARFGVTESDLEDCDSDAEMVALCAEKERDYWKTFAETGRAPDGSSDKKGTKREKPAGSTRRTDTGGDGAGSESGGDEKPATNLNNFAEGLVKHGVVPSRGIQIGDKK